MDQIEAPKIAAIARYWLRRRGDYPMPGRADIDPLDIPDLLANIMLLDVLRQPLDFRYRLIGTNLVERAGRDYTGRLLSEGVFGKATPAVQRVNQAVVEHRLPWTGCTRSFWPNRDWERVEWVVLPLGRDHLRCDQLLVAAEILVGAAARAEVSPDLIRPVALPRPAPCAPSISVARAPHPD